MPDDAPIDTPVFPVVPLVAMFTVLMLPVVTIPLAILTVWLNVDWPTVIVPVPLVFPIVSALVVWAAPIAREPVVIDGHKENEEPTAGVSTEYAFT